jgi:hypothetical protein
VEHEEIEPFEVEAIHRLLNTALRAQITTAEPGRVRGEGAADAVRRRGGEKVVTRLRLPRFAARYEAIEKLMSGPGVSAGRTFPAGMGS